MASEITVRKLPKIMVRRVASQVHKTVSRLKQAGLIPEPIWFQPVLQHPPLPIPPREPPSRSSFDASPNRHRSSARRPAPQPVVYLEDKIRRQFYRDHPFETFRARALTENEFVAPEHEKHGVHWTRLSQHGPNPEPEEAVRFAASLCMHHKMPLSAAYRTAVSQYHSLKAEHHLATAFAVHEAETYGAVFGLREVDLQFQKELKVIEQRQYLAKQGEQAAIIARKRWKMEAEQLGPSGEWSKGETYVRLWQAGVRPNYELDRIEITGTEEPSEA